MPAAIPEPVPAPPSEEEGARRVLRARWWLAGLLAVVVLTPAGAWVALNRDATRAAMRDRVEEALRARLPGARVGPALQVDTRFRVVFGPVTIPARRRGAPPVIAIEAVRVRPRWRALLGGRLEASVVSLQGVTLEPGRHGEELRAVAEQLATPRRAAGGGGLAQVRAPPRLRVSDLRVRGPMLGGRPLEYGPLSGEARLERDGARSSVEFDLHLPGRGSVGGSVAWSGQGAASMSARIDHVTRDALPDAVRRRLPAELVAGTLSGDLDGDDLRRDGGTFGWDLRADHVIVSSPRLATEPVGPLELVSRGKARVAASGRVQVDDAEVRLGGDARAAASLAVNVGPAPQRQLDVRVDAPALDWAVLARELPPQLAPGREAPRLSGTFGVELHVAGPLHDASRWALDANVDLSALERGGDSPLAGAFRHEAQLTGGRTRELVVGPQNPSFVSLATLPQHVVRAITTAEDAAFWTHDGFDFHELQDAIASGARHGRLGRGASTISQQVAKNLWLGRERTLARKVREAMLTVALEATLPKRRILEVYVNIAEWGPGIVGLGEAARHYFHKDARDLDPKEAAFLASIIPNPVRYHMYCARGELTPAWEARVDDLLTKLWSTGVLTSDQLDAALNERLVFTHGS